jgi:hypothetical protein
VSGDKESEDDSPEAQMRKAYRKFKHARENAIAAANLEQRAKAGLKHVAEILGVQQVGVAARTICWICVCVALTDWLMVLRQSDPNAPVHEVVHQIEAVLDILQEETEKNQQQKVADHGSKSVKHMAVSTTRLIWSLQGPLTDHHLVLPRHPMRRKQGLTSWRRLSNLSRPIRLVSPRD